MAPTKEERRLQEIKEVQSRYKHCPKCNSVCAVVGFSFGLGYVCLNRECGWLDKLTVSEQQARAEVDKVVEKKELKP